MPVNFHRPGTPLPPGRIGASLRLTGVTPIRTRATLSLAAALLAAPLARAQTAAPEEAAGARTPTTLTVDGRLLTGAYSAAELRGGRLFLPVVVVARALGDTVRVDASTRTVEVLRATGVRAQLNAATGQVSENGVPTLVAGNVAEVVFPADPTGLMLPTELVSALLDAQLVVDDVQGTVRVDRGLPQLVVREGSRRGPAELYSAKYGYTASSSGSSYTHSLNAAASGRAADGRLDLNSNFAGTDTGGRLFEFRSGLLSYERPGGQRLMFGDLSTGGDLAFLTSAMRGGWWRQPLGALELTTFAGRTRSDARPALPPEVPPSLAQHFDTSVVGGYFTLGRAPSPEGRRLSSSFGGLYFGGPQRQGSVLTSGVQYGTNLHQFRFDLGMGSFQGQQLDGRDVRGTGLMLDASETLTPVESLTLNAGFSHIGENVLSPQLAGFLRPLNQYSGGVSWRVHRWVSLSTSGRYAERLDLPSGSTDHDVTGTLTFFRSPSWPSLLVSHSTGRQAETGTREFTLVNVSQTFGRTELFSNLSRTRTAGTPASSSVTLGATRAFTTASVRAYQTFSTGASMSGGLDWLTSNFFTDRVGVTTGVGYSRQRGEYTSFARVGLSALLPGNQRLQLTYSQSQRSGQAFLELSGPLFEAPAARSAAQRSLETLSSVGGFSGRVYQDVNLDGRFDPLVDRALRNVEVLVDGYNTARTDENGVYRLGNVLAGEHKVYLNLLTVRADLSLLSGADQKVQLRADRDAVVDFRLIRTGRAAGLVWLDANGNGQVDEGEQPLGEVRVVAGNRDTLTGPDGDFVLGDLPQGQHTVLIDQKTLPEGMEAAAGALQVSIVPAQETGGVLLPVRAKPVEVEVKEF
ncbi:hypothetical protein FGE12_12150 [Aggregicoccus sp. 17bor-14]|uniref:hypothetical protein n=1 Tax=Myxococcaceae TaxID=31 RepID=UPI00129CA283|nr:MULTISPECIES: hypothetical protein [Myxococcaceae]MBF5043141.1 hypothetical protein [Simulacricoccus sp. 17bor-14]MRI88901.1 hypothetical protein [Aggregicoccus sp. 17bor-14]